MNRNFLFCNILTVMLFLLTEVPLYAQNNIVHAYTPFTIPATGPSGVAYPSHVRNDVISTRFGVKVANVSVPAIRYDNTVNGNQGHNMDVARFASNSLTPKIENARKFLPVVIFRQIQPAEKIIARALAAFECILRDLYERLCIVNFVILHIPPEAAHLQFHRHACISP